MTTKPGTLRVVTAAGALLATPALDLVAKTCANRDRGLLGVAVDPAFASNRFIYLYYTFNKFDNSCPMTPTTTGPVNRVSRFTLSDANVVAPASETVLLDNMLSPGGDHNAGDLQFGKDGNLYITVGDGGCDYAGGGCAGGNDAARDEQVLLGKILRITPSGAIPADNPYASDPNAARCNLTGQTSLLARCRETFAGGLRNPFRMAFDPDAAGTRFFINDVGQEAWEEIDEGVAGADYGWNVREGHCATGSTTDCGPPPAGMTNPIFDYGHEGRLQVDHRRRVRARGRRVAGGLLGHVPVRRLRLRSDLPARPERERWLHAADVRQRVVGEQRRAPRLRSARRGARAVLHDVRGRWRGATRRLRPGQ